MASRVRSTRHNLECAHLENIDRVCDGAIALELWNNIPRLTRGGCWPCKSGEARPYGAHTMSFAVLVWSAPLRINR
jgi:hypothetical protein